ncbi:hypothetical protein CERSUDRAFT_66847 [Gelatoporia subvermispora B]|uniref:Uncharacterized protein n=1 Tax=Ceriporiopsis subvermispora (strain B) TaxID=914234 RepID=M2QD97_CERS8|nr:hypothetical protein CERSUDRAFT_66847 [Gelatoporia subvermispora B]
MSNTASGWFKLARNSNTKFVACFTIPNKGAVTLSGKLNEHLERCECAQATLIYGDVSQLSGSHDIGQADFGTSISLVLDNSVRISGQLDSQVSALQTSGKGTWVTAG